MNNKLIPKEFVERLLYEYKNNFIYLDCDSLHFNDKTLMLSGKLIWQGSPYLKKPDQVFNSTESIIANHQIFYIMAIGYLANRDGINIFDDTFKLHIDHYRKILGNFVLKEQISEYNYPIFNNADDLVFRANLDKVKQTSKGIFFILSTTMGTKNFFFKLKVFLLDFDLHAGETS